MSSQCKKPICSEISNFSPRITEKQTNPKFIFRTVPLTRNVKIKQRRTNQQMRQRLRFTLSPDYWPLEMLADKDWPGVTSWVKARPRCLWNQYENRSEHPGLSKRLKSGLSKRTRAATSREPRQGFYLYKPLISQTRCPGIIRMNVGEDVGQEGGERAQNDRRLVGKR